MGALTMKNLITDVPGLKVGNAEDARIASGTTAIVFDAPAAAGFAVPGGSPALRDTGLLKPEMTVAGIDAFVLSGGSVFGLDAPGGAIAWLHAQGRGFAVGPARAPIVPSAALFDLDNGGDKDWGRRPPYFDLGWAAAEAAGLDFKLGSVGAGLGATICDLKGGLGSASAISSKGFVVGALAAVNAAGKATRGSSPRFWAAAYERGAEFGELGEGALPDDAFVFALKSDDRVNTTLAIVATDAPLDKAQATRLATMATAGFALALRPAHAPSDGDVVFAAATARSALAFEQRDLAEIGALAAECLARAIARGVYEATPLQFAGAKPSWKQKWAVGSGR
jgi:D-aminopeptidase